MEFLGLYDGCLLDCNNLFPMFPNRVIIKSVFYSITHVIKIHNGKIVTYYIYRLLDTDIKARLSLSKPFS